MSAPRKRKSPEVRRLEILDAAIAIGAERGLDAISTRDIAARIDVAPGLIHHYFPSLDGLLAESFGRWADTSLRELQDLSRDVSPRMALAFTVARLTPDQRIWHDALSSAWRYTELRARAKSLSEDYLSHVEGLIRTGVAEGQFVCADPRLSAWRIILILDGAVAMVHILELIDWQELSRIVGPVVERELALPSETFTELIEAALLSS